MTDAHSSLSPFHPVVARWFAGRFGRPTDAQAAAWPRIAAGEHVLVTAPTGSGKTLTAFLWALDRLLAGHWAVGATRVLYVSPLKALNNDIRRNLLTPLDELSAAFDAAGEPHPQVGVLTRSGDTPQSDRRRMLRRPPEILITTPESLNILLTSDGGRRLLSDLHTVILDEIHAVIDDKRGTHLISAVERLTLLAGEFQRIALSATVRPMETVAEFVGGRRREPGATVPAYRPRPVSLVRSAAKKRYDVRVRFRSPPAGDDDTELWDVLAGELRGIVEGNRSTLVFANSRRLVEKLTARINAGLEAPLAYAHHGSLSREIRREVERRLKAGELKAIVATTSLEMGIDVGALDEVVLVQSPFSISSAVQRVGRAGHQVGEVSRAELFPTHGRDVVDAAVVARAIGEQDIEAVRPLSGPLDVLAQTIVSMAACREWGIDDLHAFLRTCWPWRDLARRELDLVLDMLAGRYAEARIRELRPRVAIDRDDNTVRARPGARQALYCCGGVIPDRGLYHLRRDDSAATIGELDEEFVWEASVGQSFTLGTQSWQIRRITHNDVFVVPGRGASQAPPFWIGEEVGRDHHFALRVGEFLEEAEQRLDEPDLADRLSRDYGLDDEAVEAMLGFLGRQRAATGALPHRRRVLVEHVAAAPGGMVGSQIVLHTMWGGQVNRPLGLAMAAAWEARHGHALEVFPADDSITLLVAEDIAGEELLSLVTPENVEAMLRRRMEGSGFFGARFRECAGRAMLITRGGPRKRLPLWVNRLKSQKLLAAVMGFEDFPILLEAWRTCLRDEFDMPALRDRLGELARGAIGWSEAHTDTPSPLADAVSWRQINRYMYMTDELRDAGRSRLRDDLLGDVVFTPDLRPTVPLEVVERFERKRQRLWPGYAPTSAGELVEWAKERLAVPEGEWARLLAVAEADTGATADELFAGADAKLLRVTPHDADGALIVARESYPRLAAGLWPDVQAPPEPLDDAAPPPPAPARPDDADALAAELLGEWLAFYGPRAPAWVRTSLGLDADRLRAALADLIDDRKVIEGELTAGADGPEICDSETFETLLRLARAAAGPDLPPRPAEHLPAFLARWQGLVHRGEDVESLRRRIEQLACLPLPASAWEADVLPARVADYRPAMLDEAFAEGDLLWIGSGKQRVAFCFDGDMELLARDAAGEAPDAGEPPGADAENAAGRPPAADLLPDLDARYDFSALLRATGLDAKELNDRLWAGVWRGEITNDSFLAVRRGLANRFAVEKAPTLHLRGRRRPGRRALKRWKGSHPAAGNWLAVPAADGPAGLLEREERAKDRARVLLDRYGVVFRELLAREAEGFRFGDVFRALRLMELAGEVVAGCFFEGVPGVQFATPAAVRALADDPPAEATWWVSAADPASLCGTGLEIDRRTLPSRLAGTHVVYRGMEVAMVSRRRGKELTLADPPDDPRLPEVLAVLAHLAHRDVQPVRRIAVETINDARAAESPYAAPLAELFEVHRDVHKLMLFRKRI